MGGFCSLVSLHFTATRKHGKYRANYRTVNFDFFHGTDQTVMLNGTDYLD
jgi:hypothetical protein